MLYKNKIEIDQVKKVKVEVIKSKTDLERMSPFYVNNLLWGTVKCPRTYGYIACLKNEAILIKLICEESNPHRTYNAPNDPVYLDSAVEAFLLFHTQNSEKAGIYLNFEVNSNGAMLAAYGKNRKGRTFISDEIRKEIGCEANILDGCWTVELEIPLNALKQIYGSVRLEKGEKFYCNFYKIAEKNEIKHFASYARVESETPNFHLPEFFEEAEII